MEKIVEVIAVLSILALFSIPIVLPLLWFKKSTRQKAKRGERKKRFQEIKHHRNWRLTQVIYLITAAVFVITAFNTNDYSETAPSPLLRLVFVLVCYPLLKRLYVYIVYGGKTEPHRT